MCSSPLNSLPGQGWTCFGRCCHRREVCCRRLLPEPPASKLGQRKTVSVQDAAKKCPSFLPITLVLTALRGSETTSVEFLYGPSYSGTVDASVIHAVGQLLDLGMSDSLRLGRFILAHDDCSPAGSPLPASSQRSQAWHILPVILPTISRFHSFLSITWHSIRHAVITATWAGSSGLLESVCLLVLLLLLQVRKVAQLPRRQSCLLISGQGCVSAGLLVSLGDAHVTPTGV